MIKLNIFLSSLTIVLAGCTISPKADYTRTFIDRPYNLQKDIAKVHLGAKPSYVKETIEATNTDPEFTDKEKRVLVSVDFENGLHENFSWIYPLGFRVTPYKDKINSIGFSVFTLFVYSELSADYWIRVGGTTSLRLAFEGTILNSFFYDQRTWGPKVELVQQFSKHTAGSISYKYQKLHDKTDFIFISSETYFDGHSAELMLMHSLSDRWDLVGSVEIGEYEGIDETDYKIKAGSLILGANYFW